MLIRLFLLTLILTGCASTEPLGDALNQPLSFNQRQAALNTLSTWHIEGVVSISTPQETQTANVVWQLASPNNYALSLMGPLGLGRVTLTQSPENALLTARNKTLTAQNPELLMQENLGWSVPVKNYYYWVRGIPAPHLPYQKTMDRYHHIQTLSQQGWRIDYLSYQSYQGIDIPRKIRLRYGKLTLLWVTQLWQS